MTDEKVLEKKENMTVKLDSAVGFQRNETAGEVQYKNHIKAISHILKEKVADDKFDERKNEIDKKISDTTTPKT